MTGDLPLDLQSAFSPRFDLRRVLGRGGMATVYLAEDHKHRREVALKVLRPDLAASIGSERFLKEIEIAARLTHPHILALHDSGEAGGFLYYVMPYLDGPSLRQRLEREGRLALGEAFDIVDPVADALSYAHRVGIFHRDIKPENILFSQGHPMVADFGIAKAISTAGGANLTRTGFPLGTPGYMSPEQAAGLSDLDERTDVYGLAVVTYEMLVGEVPGRWPTEEAVRTGRFLEAPAGHRARLTQAGPVVEAAMVRALAIRVEERTPTPQAFMQDLAGTAPPRRRYSESEIQEIVKRATEMEASNPTGSGAMTMGGVEALAAEVGIDSDAVRRAAASVTDRTPAAGPILSPRPNRLIGGPTRILYERVVEGEVADADFPLLVDEIRRVMQNVGQVSQLGRSFSWTGSRGRRAQGDMEIAVTARGGCTRIIVQENLANLIGGVFGGIGGGMGGGGMGVVSAIAGALGAPALLPVLMPLWLATTFAVARTTYHYASRSRVRQLALVADRLADLVRELAPQRQALRGQVPRLPA